MGSGSSRSERGAVKAPGGLGRHLEGWQPGLLAVLVAGIPTLLAVPQPVPPAEIPEPMLDPRALDRLARDEAALATLAEAQRLDTDVRELGSALRAYSLAEAAGDVAGIAQERRNVAQAGKRAAAHGDAEVLRLRAYQLRSFLRELRRWEQTGEETDELRELGGPFLDRARYNGWVEGRRLLPDDTVRAALFKKRWVELTMLRGPALEAGAPETCALYRFLLLHPPREVTGDARTAAADQRAAHAAEKYRLRKIDELHALDPAYPFELARGVVYYRLHSYGQAVEAFRHHLEDHPDGPYKLRAQNYLKAALGAAMEPL